MDREDHRVMSEAAMEPIRVESLRAEIAGKEQKKREFLIAETYRMLGRIETSDLFGKLAQCATFVWLKKVKDSKVYKDLPGIGTWESFCNQLGKSRRSVDDQLQSLDIMGEEFLARACQFSVGYKDLRKLRKRITDGEISIDDKTVIIAGEQIPLDPDHTEDIEAAIESILDDKNNQIEDGEATLRAKDRVLAEKEKVINKQEVELAKNQKQLEARGFEPGEENFIRDMENLKTMIVGMELKMDPRNMPADMTPLMRAALIETLGHARRTFTAYYDEATNFHGDGSDDDWTPPYEREEKEAESKEAESKEAEGSKLNAEGSKLNAEGEDERPTGGYIPLPTMPPDGETFVDCSQCHHHKGMSNSKKGVKIPGNFGKCTRPEGHCIPTAAVKIMKKGGIIDNDAE